MVWMILSVRTPLHVKQAPPNDTPLMYIVHDFEQAFREFLLGYEDSEIKRVQDLISFNTANADRELPLGNTLDCV